MQTVVVRGSLLQWFRIVKEKVQLHIRFLHKCNFHFGIISTFLGVAFKWYVPIVVAAICIPCCVEASEPVFRNVPPEASHGAFMADELFVKDLEDRGAFSVNSDLIGVVLAEESLSFGEGVPENGSGMVEFIAEGGISDPPDSEPVIEQNSGDDSSYANDGNNEMDCHWFFLALLVFVAGLGVGFFIGDSD